MSQLSLSRRDPEGRFLEQERGEAGGLLVRTVASLRAGGPQPKKTGPLAVPAAGQWTETRASSFRGGGEGKVDRFPQIKDNEHEGEDDEHIICIQSEGWI